MDGVRLYDQEDGTEVVNSSGGTETTCTTLSGTHVSPWTFYSDGYYNGSHYLGALYYDSKTVSWNGHSWHVSGATNAHG